MKKLRDCSVHEVTYRYENERQMQLHKSTMFTDGYRVENDLPFLNRDPLTVTYRKSKLNDNIARL